MRPEGNTLLENHQFGSYPDPCTKKITVYVTEKQWRAVRLGVALNFPECIREAIVIASGGKEKMHQSLREIDERIRNGEITEDLLAKKVSRERKKKSAQLKQEMGKKKRNAESRDSSESVH